ncbi:MAG: YeeE/YedE family protein [Dethiosulfovibrio peptidovorans]|nr:MAG: YeeE/YedE family protein [Dethiosulfovibrio peptidovorans]
MFQSLMGVGTGFLFGILMHRSEVLRYDRQLGALLLEDMTIIKFLLSAIMTGMIGIQILNYFGWVTLSVKPTVMGTNLVGGVIFGIGWALLGYCPATAVGALGEGRFDALAGLIGMVCGAMLFAEFYPFIRISALSWGALGPVTLPGLSGTSPWPWVVGFGALSLLLMYLFERYDL